MRRRPFNITATTTIAGELPIKERERRLDPGGHAAARPTPPGAGGPNAVSEKWNANACLRSGFEVK